MMRKSTGPILLAACGLLLALAACGARPTPTPAVATAPLPTLPAAATPAARSQLSILADGQLVAVNPPLPLAFSSSGRLITITVQAGDWISAGELLACIEIPDLETRLEQAQLNLASAEAALARAQQDQADALYEAQISLEKTRIAVQQAEGQDVDSQVTIAYTRLRQAEEGLARAQEAYNRAWDSARDWELYMTDPTGVFPFEGPSMSKQLEQEREATRLGVQSAQDNLTVARAEYNQVIASRDAHALDLQALPQDLTLAEFRVEQLGRAMDPSLALNVDKARLELQTLEDQSSNTELLAPWDGMILSVEQSPGGQVGPGIPIVTLFDPRRLQFQTSNLSERDLAQVRVGQEVTLILKSYPDNPLTGTVLRIAPQASGMVGDAAAFPVIIELAPTDLLLLPGMTGRVEISGLSS